MGGVGAAGAAGETGAAELWELRELPELWELRELINNIIMINPKYNSSIAILLVLRYSMPFSPSY